MLWYAPRAKITGYRLFLTVEGSNPKQLRLPSRLTQYTLLNLKPDTKYTATLHAEQENTLSEGESATFTTGECLMHIKISIKLLGQCEYAQREPVFGTQSCPEQGWTISLTK